MSYELRPVTREEFPAFVETDITAFAGDPREAPIDELLRTIELDRTLGVFDSASIVGCTAIFSFRLSVPGGALPCAGVTWVAVRATHRRRGILRQMMARQLADVRERGEPVAALWASESLIYGRFGYGLAAEDYEYTIDRRNTQLAHNTAYPGSLRMVDRDEALRTWPAIYDAVAATRPGMMSRSAAWWEARVLPPDDSPSSKGRALRRVTYEHAGQCEGYVHYETKGHWEDGIPMGTVAVSELMATTDEAYSALWQHVFGVDLMQTISAHRRPVDDPLSWMLNDPRRLKRTVRDSLWVRILDVERALAGRRYSREGRLVFAVEDSFIPDVGGTFVLEGGPDGATCRRTDETPELRLGAAELGAISLGAGSLQTLAHAGRVSGSPGALRRADAMFTWQPAPWCPEVF